MDAPRAPQRRPACSRLALPLLFLLATTLGCSGGGGNDGGPTGPLPDTLTLTADPTSIAVFGNTRITAVARRGDGSPIEGATVSFTTTVGTLDAATAATDANGAAVTRLRGDGQNGTARLEARLGTSAVRAVLQVSVGSNGRRVEMTASPTSIAPGETSEIGITVREATDAPAVGVRLTVTTDLGRVDDATVTTDSSGSARTLLRTDVGRTGAATVSARAEGGGEEGKVEVQVGDGRSLTLEATPSDIGINGTSRIAVEVRRFDGSVEGEGVRVNLRTSLGRFDDTGPRTNAAGVAVAELRADGRAGVALVTAGAENATDAEIEVRIGTDVSLELRVNPQIIDGGGTSTVTAVVSGPNGAPLGGTEVRFSTSLGQLSADSRLTDGSGLATVELTTVEADEGTATLTATLPGLDVSISTTVVVQ
ncbi:MAG: Ig-like domain-containing protein [Acidobacteriota bacterium]